MADQDGCLLIWAERQRLINEEGWTVLHDNRQAEGDFRKAATAYIQASSDPAAAPPDVWPWDPAAWTDDSDPLHLLVKAGAMIATEIDRLQRAAAKENSS